MRVLRHELPKESAWLPTQQRLVAWHALLSDHGDLHGVDLLFPDRRAELEYVRRERLMRQLALTEILSSERLSEHLMAHWSGLGAAMWGTAVERQWVE